MSDIDIVEITPKPSGNIKAPRSSSAPAKPEPQPGDKWVRTKFCWCPDNAATDCRFHSKREPGWETCPWENRAGRGPGRWLWISLGTPLSDEELSAGADIKELTSAQRRGGDKYLG